MFPRSSHNIQILKPFVRFSSNGAQKITRVPNKFNKVHSASNVKPIYKSGLYQHTAPSIGIETPDVFLPSNDPRKGLNLSGSKRVDIKNAPALSIPKELNYNLTPVEVEEIQKLRIEEPEVWTLKKLSEKFNVSKFTISLVSDPNSERQREMENRLETIKNSWKKNRFLARLDRKKRQVSWYRDE